MTTSEMIYDYRDIQQNEFDGTIGAKRIIEVPYAMRMAYTADGMLEYVGMAAPGSAEASAVWRIKKMIYVAGQMTQALWCDGNDKFDNTWTNYGTHTYT